MSSSSASQNVRLTLAYDGGKFQGWQVQANGPTIQAELERAIFELTGERSAVFSAGRTDSGVHALGQVANFHTHSPIRAEKFRAALQTHLPPEIVILESRLAPPEFHATFSARSKRYRYLLDNSPIALPFLQNYSWWHRRRLDVPAMQAAAQHLIGTHDFRSFETDWPNKATSVRTVFELSVRRTPLWYVWFNQPTVGRSPAEPGASLSRGGVEDDSLVCLEIAADGFLYNMVRSITGTLVNVGRGKWSADDVARILAGQDRKQAGATAPACGLYLVDVTYDEQ